MERTATRLAARRWPRSLRTRVPCRSRWRSSRGVARSGRRSARSRTTRPRCPRSPASTRPSERFRPAERRRDPRQQRAEQDEVVDGVDAGHPADAGRSADFPQRHLAGGRLRPGLDGIAFERVGVRGHGGLLALVGFTGDPRASPARRCPGRRRPGSPPTTPAGRATGFVSHASGCRNSGTAHPAPVWAEIRGPQTGRHDPDGQPTTTIRAPPLDHQPRRKRPPSAWPRRSSRDRRRGRRFDSELPTTIQRVVSPAVGSGGEVLSEEPHVLGEGDPSSRS